MSSEGKKILDRIFNLVDRINPAQVKITKDVLAEVQRSLGIHGGFNSPHEGYAIIKEELDELWADIKSQRPSKHMYHEAKQIAAMAMVMMLECEKWKKEEEV